MGHLRFADPMTETAFHVARQLDEWVEQVVAGMGTTEPDLTTSVNMTNWLRASVCVTSEVLTVSLGEFQLWHSECDSFENLTTEFCKRTFSECAWPSGRLAVAFMNERDGTDRPVLQLTEGPEDSE